MPEVPVEPLRYERLRPDELEAAWSRRPLAVCPWGALEWHGAHLPLGLDGLVAAAFSETLAARTGGVLLPTTWHPITTLPHPMSLQIGAEVFRGLVGDLLAGLRGAGARVVAIVTGHYAQGHEIELYRAARSAMRGHPDLRVLAGTPLELLDEDDLLDHAGRWETSQLLAMDPSLVRTDALPPPPLQARRDGVLGRDPREASAEEGARLLARGQEAWTLALERLLAEPDGEWLEEFYRRREAAYQGYVDRYFRGSWDEAIRVWWNEQPPPDPET